MDSAYGRSFIISYPGGAVLDSFFLEGSVYGRSFITSYPVDAALSAKCTTPDFQGRFAGAGGLLCGLFVDYAPACLDELRGLIAMPLRSAFARHLSAASRPPAPSAAGEGLGGPLRRAALAVPVAPIR